MDLVAPVKGTTAAAWVVAVVAVGFIALFVGFGFAIFVRRPVEVSEEPFEMEETDFGSIIESVLGPDADEDNETHAYDNPLTDSLSDDFYGDEHVSGVE
jgi:hypothetical protein